MFYRKYIYNTTNITASTTSISQPGKEKTLCRKEGVIRTEERCFLNGNKNNNLYLNILLSNFHMYCASKVVQPYRNRKVWLAAYPTYLKYIWVIIHNLSLTSSRKVPWSIITDTFLYKQKLVRIFLYLVENFSVFPMKTGLWWDH